jgi:hypothetical protein
MKTAGIAPKITECQLDYNFNRTHWARNQKRTGGFIFLEPISSILTGRKYWEGYRRASRVFVAGYVAFSKPVSRYAGVHSVQNLSSFHWAGLLWM